MTRLGIKTGLSDSIPRLIRNIADPKGMLIPGIETGSKNGAVKIMQDMNSPRSPIISRNSSKLIPSSGIFEEISSITIEKCSTLSNFSDNINTPNILLIFFRWKIFQLAPAIAMVLVLL